MRKLRDDFCYEDAEGDAATPLSAAAASAHKRARGDMSGDEDWCEERELSDGGATCEDDSDADTAPAQRHIRPEVGGVPLVSRHKPGRGKLPQVSKKARNGCSYRGKGKCM